MTSTSVTFIASVDHEPGSDYDEITTATAGSARFRQQWIRFDKACVTGTAGVVVQ